MCPPPNHLVVLVYEVSQNTQVLHNEADIEIYEMAADNSQMFFSSEQPRSLMLESKSWGEFSNMEQMMLGFYWGNEVDRAELQYRLSKRNQIDLDNIIFYEPDLRLLSFQDW